MGGGRGGAWQGHRGWPPLPQTAVCVAGSCTASLTPQPPVRMGRGLMWCALWPAAGAPADGATHPFVYLGHRGGVDRYDEGTLCPARHPPIHVRPPRPLLYPKTGGAGPTRAAGPRHAHGGGGGVLPGAPLRAGGASSVTAPRLRFTGVTGPLRRVPTPRMRRTAVRGWGVGRAVFGRAVPSALGSRDA